MAVAVDLAVDGGNNGGTTTSLQWTHSVSGSQRVLVVLLQSGTNPTGITVTTDVGAGTLALTRLTSQYDALAYYSSIWYYINPPTGTNTIVVSKTGGNTIFAAGSVSFTGASQSAPMANATTASGNNTTVTLNVTATSGSYIVDSFTAYTSNSITWAADQGTEVNKRQSATTFNGGSHYIAYSSSPQTMSWTATGGSYANWSQVGAIVQEFPSGSDGSPMMVVSD